jgi:hypothetical protein
MAVAAPREPVAFGPVQMKTRDDPARNSEHAIGLIRQAAASGATLICLPELFGSRYFCQVEDTANFDLAESVPGPTTDRLAVLAAELDVVIIASVFERRAAGLFHNTAAVLDGKRGYLGKYRKMHIPDDPRYHEKFYFAPGDLGFQGAANDNGPVEGVKIVGVTPGTGAANDNGPVEGVKIVGVTPGTAAEDAGLRAGDIITAINGDSMSAASAREAGRLITDFMAGVEQGDILEVEYLRDGKVGSVEVEPRPVEMRTYAFGGMPRDFSMPAVPDVHVSPEIVEKFSNRFVFAWPGNVWADMELVELNEGLGKYFGADSGVLVVSAPESDSLQLEDGDVIVSIDGREPTSVRHALRILGSYQPGESLELQILREKRKRTLEIEVPDNRQSMRWEQAPAPRPAVAPRAPAPPRPGSEKT